MRQTEFITFESPIELTEKIPFNVLKVMSILHNHNHDAYLVGSSSYYHYQQFMDRSTYYKPKDYDIFTNATPDQILMLFPKGKIVGGQERMETMFTVTLAKSDPPIEISTYRGNPERTIYGNTIYDHLATCDFTVNAVAIGFNMVIVPREIHHNYTHKIRCVNHYIDRFEEDPKRILRALVCSAKYKYVIGEDEDRYLLSPNARELYKSIPAEVIKETLIKLSSMHLGPLLMDVYFDLIKESIPEMAEFKDIPGGNHHYEGVFDHAYLSNSIALQYYEPEIHNPILPLTAFLHDIGKGYAYRVNENKKFSGHEKYGAEIIEVVGNRLKFSSAEIAYMKTVIRYHMMDKMKDPPSRTKFFKMFNKLEEANVPIDEFLLILYADRYGRLNEKGEISIPESFEEFKSNNLIKTMYDDYMSNNLPRYQICMEIDGHDVMKHAKVKGKQVGEIKDKIYEMILEEQIPNDRKTLISKLKEYVNEENDTHEADGTNEDL